MQRFWSFLLDPRALTVIGVLALAALLLLSADALRMGLYGAVMLLACVLTVWLLVWLVRRWRTRRAARALEQALDAQASDAVKVAERRGAGAEVSALRERMAEAVKRIKSSRLGELSGSAALYELPWYAIIGNPAAGKSSAIVKSGLKFPFAENTDNIIQGIGGTRHCDWYFTSEGIVLDTAGRYAVHEEDRDEWLSFLSLLKKYRAKAPLNGVIIAVSVAELVTQKSDFGIELARKLRLRVQELTERLEVFVPVYVMFTKADLIAGFVDFFEDRDRAERDKAWGATLPYEVQGRIDAAEAFDHHFEVLYQGLKEASVARMAMHRGEQLPPGVLTFPLEFAALKPALRTFIHTLFEDNPYQFQPVFRGFYFSSAVQEGQSTSRASQRVAEQFGLQLQPGTAAAVYSQSGFFLRELFSRVIFADRRLVQQYTSRHKLRLRYASFFGGVVVLGALLAGWTWSYMGNRQLVANVEADLVKAQQVQTQRVDLQSRLDALAILQDRLEQIQRYRETHPWSIGLGLYQGDAIEDRLREEYFHGLRVVLLQPAAQAMEAYLAEVNARADDLKPLRRGPDGTLLADDAAPPVAVLTSVSTESGQSPYARASSADVTEAYNALKAYLMLGDRSRLESAHMSDQLTRFWRGWLEDNRGGMTRQQMIRHAESTLSFALSQVHAADFPQIDLNLGLLDQTRDTLRRVVKGMPARERVYGEIKARAATRFAPVTVVRLVQDADRQLVSGSHAVSGVFTREAWEGYVKEAIQDAANKELQSSDWVLKTAVADDLTLEGSPEQIEKVLTRMYKTEYVKEWQRFMQGITVQEFGGFDQAVLSMNRLGDRRHSPVGVLLQTLYEQTSWDNPSVLNERLAGGQMRFLNWFKQRILSTTPSRANVDVNLQTDQLKAIPMGPIGQEFSALTKVVMAREGGEPMLSRYLAALAKVRTRFNQMKAQGDPGPGARQLMAQTLAGQGELAEALQLVDEQMLVGMSETARAALRPILVRPLMQAFAVVVGPTEQELNRVWTAQVYEPYQRTLANKYPFDPQSRMEASPQEVSQIFGSSGAVAQYVDKTLTELVLRRGDVLTPRTWADIGVRLQPAFVQGVASWLAPLNGQGAASPAGGPTTPASEAQTVFQVLPLPAPGLTEYSVEVDGQVLRYRQGAASWTHYVWPGPGTPGARVSAVTYDGRTIDLLNEPGRFGLEKMVNAAQRRKLDDGVFELAWGQGDPIVKVRLRIISNVSTPGGATHAAASPDARGASTGALPAQVAGLDASGGQP